MELQAELLRLEAEKEQVRPPPSPPPLPHSHSRSLLPLILKHPHSIHSSPLFSRSLYVSPYFYVSRYFHFSLHTRYCFFYVHQLEIDQDRLAGEKRRLEEIDDLILKLLDGR